MAHPFFTPSIKVTTSSIPEYYIILLRIEEVY